MSEPEKFAERVQPGPPPKVPLAEAPESELMTEPVVGRTEKHTPLPRPTWRTVLRLAIPTIAEQFISAFIGFTDAWLAGHIPGDSHSVAAAAAAVGNMMYIQWLAGLLVSFIGTGAIAVVSRSVGARRIRVANRVAGTAVSAATVVGLAVAVVMFLFAEPFVRLSGLSGLAAVFGTQYLRIMCVTLCFQSAATIGMACLRGAGDMVRPMLIMIAVAVVNLIASSVLTLGLFGAPAWGVQGNALGTLLAFLTGGVATIIVLLGGFGKLKLRLRHFAIVPHIVMRIGRIGVPSGLEGILLWGGQFIVIALVINGGKDDAVTMAAHSAVLRVESLSFLPGFGFGIAASSLVGQYLGAKRPEDSKKAARISLGFGAVLMTLLALPMVIFPTQMLGFMVNSPEVVAAGKWPMVLAGLAQPGFALAIVMGSSLRGAGDTVAPMVATISGVIMRLIAVLPIAFYLRSHRQAHWILTSVWIVIFLDLLYRGIFNTIVFGRGKWQLKRV